MVTLKDIAEEAHVSLMTVSNVVNGKYSKVSKERLKEIQWRSFCAVSETKTP